MCIICFIKWFKNSERSLVKNNARSRHSCSITHRIYMTMLKYYSIHSVLQCKERKNVSYRQLQVTDSEQ